MPRLFVIFLFLLLATQLFGAKIEFTGLKSYSSDRLLEAIAGRLDYIRNREATDSRADDAAFLVETYLQSHGLPDAMVLGKAISKKKIQLNVTEGLSQFLGPITVIGFKDIEQVTDQFKAPFPESGERRAFEASAIDIGLNRIQELLHVDGYWDGSVTSTRGKRNQNGEIPFVIRIKQGPLFVLARPTLKTSVVPDANLLESLEKIKGKTATAEAITAARGRVTNSYVHRGYTDIDLEMIKKTSGNQLQLSFLLSPGKKYSVRAFKVDGLKKTKSNFINYRFEKLVGKTYDEDYANEEIKKLLAIGAFSAVKLQKEDADKTAIDLTLHLKESKARGYSVALGYGSIEGYVVGLRYYDRNLRGNLWNLSAGAELTSLGGLGEVSLTDPFFLNRDLSLTTRAFLNSRDFDNYRKVQGGIGADLSWKWGENYSATAGIDFSNTSTSSPIPDKFIGATNYLVTRLGWRQLYDNRDDPALPSDGWFARLDTSLGLSYGDESVGFLEVESQISYYQTLGGNTAFALGFRGGFISPTVDNESLPIDLRKFQGGANTIRSFPELEMGPSFDGYALGGTKWWLANAEYMHTIAGPIRGIVFIDTAGLDSEVELAAGVGVRINLPVGPIRFEYGRSLSQDSGEPSGAFHFAIGTTF
ncbi:MAG: BamA/TamA family outer membrane protein [Akkermansiaceae bacterium]